MNRNLLDTLLNALAPIFAGLLLGFFAGRRRWVDNGNVRNLIVMVMNFAIPSALFALILRTPRDVLQRQAWNGLVIAIAFGAVYALCYYFARFRRLNVSDSAVVALTFGFSNSAAIALALLSSAFGPKAAVSGGISIAVGAITISPLTLTLLEAGRVAKDGRVGASLFVSCFARALRRPIVCAPLLAFVCVALNLSFPAYVMRSLDVLGNAGTGTALVLTGIILSAQSFQLTLPVLAVAIAKVILEPLAAIGVAKLVHLQPSELRNIALICAIPGGFFGLVFGKSFNVTPQLASSGLITTYILSVVTLPLWIIVLNHFF